jgi:hypothetical protein
MAEDVAALGITVDSQQVQTGIDRLENLQAVARRTHEPLDVVRARFQAAGQAANQNATATGSAAAAAQKAAAAHGAMGAAIGGAGGAANAMVPAHRNLGNALNTVTGHGVSQRTMWRALAHEIGLFNPEAAHVVQHLGFMSTGFSHLGAGLAISAVAVGATTFVVAKAIEEFALLEKRITQTNSALNLIKGASSQSGQGLEELAHEMSLTGTQSVQSVRDAIGELIKFRQLGPDAFKETLEAAKDLAATGFVDLKGAASALTKAFADPVKANEALAETGARLTVEQEKLVRAFVNTGQTGKAIQTILHSVSEQAKGSDAAATGTLSAAWTRLKNSGDTILEQWGHAIVQGTNLTAIINGLARSLDKASGNSASRDFSGDTAKAIAAAQNPSRNLVERAARAGITVEELQARLKVTQSLAVAEYDEGVAFSSTTEALNRRIATEKEHQVAAAESKRKLDEVIKALQEQGETAGMTAVQAAVYNEVIKAGVQGNKEATAAIREQVAANMSATEFRSTIDGLKQQAAATQIQAATVGMSAGAAAAYTAAETARQNAIIRGLPLTAKQNELVERQAQAIGGATQKAAQDAARRNADFERETALMSDLEKQIATVQRSLHGDAWKDFMNDGISATMRVTASLKMVQDAAIQLGQGLVGGMLDGKSAADALHQSLEAVSKTAANATVSNLIKGDLGSAAVSAGIGVASFIGSKLFGGKSDEQKQAEAQALAAAQQKAAEQTAANLDATRRYYTALVDTSTVEGQVQAKRLQNLNEIVDAQAKGLNVGELVVAQTVELNQMFNGIAKTARDNLAPPLSSVQQQLEGITKNASDLAFALSHFGQSADEATRLAADATKRVRDAFEKDVADKINAAQGRGYISQVADLVEQIAQMQKDASALGLQPDRIQKLFEVQAQSIVEQANLTGDAFHDLVTEFPQLTNVVHSATGQIEQLGKSIKDYLLNLQFGQLSTLSPQAQLSAAQQAFEAQLTAARAGDQSALSTITKAADTLLTTARSFFASSGGYSVVYDQVVNALSSLSGARNGGLLGLAFGGMVPGGTYNQDSILARFAGGGSVMLAGGEYVTRAPSVNASTLPMLNQINRTGSANDNHRDFAGLAQVIIASNNAIINSLQALEGAFRESGKRAEDAARIASNRVVRPGEKVA